MLYLTTVSVYVLSLCITFTAGIAPCTNYYNNITCSSGNPTLLNVTAEPLYACAYDEPANSTNYTLSDTPQCTVLCTQKSQLVAFIPDLNTQFFLTEAVFDSTQWILTQTANPDQVEWESSTNIEFTCVSPVVRCTPYIDQTGEHANICVKVDQTAQCNEVGDPMCTCTGNYTGSTCSITYDDIALVTELAGGNPDIAATLFDVLDQARSTPVTLLTLLPAIYATWNESTRISWGFTMDEMLDSIDYERENIDLETEITFSYDPNMGNCYTFNYANQTESSCILARMPGAHRDLTVQVKLNQSEQVAWIEAVAMQIYIHAPGTPMTDGLLYSLKSGASDIISLKKTVTRMTEECVNNITDLPKGQNYYMDGGYSVDNCYDSCYQDAAYAKCGCMDAQYQHPTTIPDCLYNQTACLTQVQAQMGDVSEWNCSCPQSCYQETYDLESTRAGLPFKIPPCDNETAGCPDMNDAMARLRVFMETLETQQYVEVDKMTYSTCLSQIGGQLGFLLGMSIVGVIELVLLCCHVCRSKNDDNPPSRQRRQ